MGGCHAGSGRIMPEVVPPQRGRASFTATASSAFPKGNFRGNNIAALVCNLHSSFTYVISHDLQNTQGRKTGQILLQVRK